MPILLYGCEIWGFQNTKQIEIAHKKYFKQILKLNNRTPTCMIYGELGITSVSEVIDNRMVNFWSKLVHGKNTQISHVVFKLLFNMYEKVFFQSPWLIKVKKLLDNTGMSNIWNNESFNQRWLKNAFCLRCSDIYNQNWSSEVNHYKMCSNYKIFKNKKQIEPYLLKLEDELRLYLCKFRCGNNKIPKNLALYFNESGDKICKLCDKNEIGECHNI